MKCHCSNHKNTLFINNIWCGDIFLYVHAWLQYHCPPVYSCTKNFNIFMVNLSELESTIISICVPMKQHLASPGRRGNHGNSATGQPPAPVKLIESVHGIDYTYHILFLTYFLHGSWWMREQIEQLYVGLSTATT